MKMTKFNSSTQVDMHFLAHMSNAGFTEKKNEKKK